MSNTSLLQSIAVNRYFVAALTLLVYDYFLTFTAEIQAYWSPIRFSWASFFFFANRYVALAGHFPLVFEYFSQLSEKRCRQLQVYHQFYSGALVATVSSLLIMRTHALYGRDTRLLIFLVGSCAIAGAVSCWALFPFRGHPPPSTTNNAYIAHCNLPFTETQGRYLAVVWGSVTAFDSIIFCLTLYKRLSARVWVPNTLFSLMIRDGVVYYGILLILYILDIVSFLVGTFAYKGIGTTPTNVMASILMSRLMLNIRVRNPRTTEIHSSVSTSIPFHWAESNSADRTST